MDSHIEAVAIDIDDCICMNCIFGIHVPLNFFLVNADADNLRNLAMGGYVNNTDILEYGDLVDYVLETSELAISLLTSSMVTPVFAI